MQCNLVFYTFVHVFFVCSADGFAYFRINVEKVDSWVTFSFTFALHYAVQKTNCFEKKEKKNTTKSNTLTVATPVYLHSLSTLFKLHIFHPQKTSNV